MNYKSPIDLIITQVETNMENEIVRAVQRVGVNIDKEELIRALAYDRGQYAKGYYDRDSEIVRCKDCIHHHIDNDGCQYCDRIDYGYGWKDDDFCSKAEVVK